MLNKYQKHMEDALKMMVRDMIVDMEPFSIIVATTDDWEFPLPAELVSSQSMVLTLSGWSLEQARLVEEGQASLFVRLAFGDNENSKMLKISEIHAVMGSDNKPLYQRVFDSTIKNEDKPETYTLKGLLGTPENELPNGIKTSMNKMIENNPDMFKKENE